MSIRYSDTSRWSRFSRAFLRFFGQGRQFPSVADPQSSFQAIFEMIGVGVVQFNLDGRLIKCNRAFCELVGYTLEEVLRVPAGGLTHPDDLKKDHEERSRLLCGEAPSYTREKRYVRKDGSIVWVMVSVSLIRRSSGRPKFYVGVIQDITSRRTAEQARSESRARLRVALEAGRMGTWERELATGRDVWSEQQELLFGLRPGSFDQRHETFVQMVHPEDRAGMEAALQHAIEHREPYRSEFRVVFPDGAVRWMSGRGDVIWSAQGRPTHVVGVTLDITDRKRAEQERAELLVREQRARADAEAANRRKDQFLAVLSHELRTPLTPVLGRVALMHRDSALTPELRSGLDMIRRNVELEARLIDDLLDMTRLIRGSLRLNRELIDAHQKLRNALEIYQGEISLRRLEVALDLSAEHYRVLGDASRVQQIFWNLISNAVKYTPVGGRITIRSYNREHAQADTPDGSLLVVEVADTGIGIEPEMMQRLFDPFEQGEQTLARRYGGLGLGLSISRSLARMHGGDLKARSEGKNGGSTFTVEFPTAPADLLAARAAPSPRRELRILLVEDNEDTLRVMARLLRLSGYQVKTASGMRPALDLAVREEFDLLISDIGLPDGTGWELMRELRVRRPVKGIALSGFSMDEDVQKSRNVGFLEHLCKPINPQELEDAIQRAAT